MQNAINLSSVPPPFTFYRGGLNIGVFNPGPPVYPEGSEVFGNEFGGSPYTYKTQSNDVGEKSFGWVIILSGEDSTVVTRSTKEPKHTKTFSYYDGFYNKNQLSSVGKNFVLSFQKGNYKDWYIPSRDELAFILKNLPQDFSFDFRFKPMGYKTYLSSSYAKNQLGKEDFLYAQSFIPNTYGVTSLVLDTTLMNVRYIRRVPVNII
jgi:hypothetical protein